MAFVNEEGQSISYDCSGLIDQLEKDIEKYGGETLVYVKTEYKNGVTIYKDYYILSGNDSMIDNNMCAPLTMSALMLLYEAENSII